MIKNTENQENFNITEDETQRSKKFVFKIYSENIDFIESLSYQDKNDVVNQMLYDYRSSSVLNKKFNNSINITKKAAIIFLAAVIGIPLIIYLTSISLDLTKSSYSDMQKNFEKLF